MNAIRESAFIGENTTASLRIVILAIGLFLAVFAVVGLELDDGILPAIGSVFYLLLVLLIGLAGVVTYYNEGLLVAIFLTFCPTYAVAVHLVHVGWTGPVPYPTAAIKALLLGVIFGLIPGLLGGAGGLLAKRHLG